MISDLPIEAVKFFGGLGGLASSAFLIYDRVVRFRPIIDLVPVQYTTSLRLRNASPSPIIVDRIIVFPREIVQVSAANDQVSAKQDVATVWYPGNSSKPQIVFIYLKPEAERTFALKRSAAFEEASEKTLVTFRCRWRSPTKPFPFPRRVTIRATVGDIRAIRDASLADKINWRSRERAVARHGVIPSSSARAGARSPDPCALRGPLRQPIGRERPEATSEQRHINSAARDVAKQRWRA
jgi:hypothetical protein